MSGALCLQCHELLRLLCHERCIFLQCHELLRLLFHERCIMFTVWRAVTFAVSRAVHYVNSVTSCYGYCVTSCSLSYQCHCIFSVHYVYGVTSCALCWKFQSCALCLRCHELCNIIIIIIIIIKKDRQCKAGRGRLTPYQSEDPSPTLPIYRGKEEKGKIVEDKKGESN